MTAGKHHIVFKASSLSAFPALLSPSMVFPSLPLLEPATSSEPSIRQGSAMSRLSARSARWSRAEADRAREAKDAGEDKERGVEDQARLARELHRPSSRASAYGHYDPSTYVDPAFVQSAKARSTEWPPRRGRGRGRRR